MLCPPPGSGGVPGGGGFSYILEGEELRDFLALLNGAQFHRAVYGRSGGSKMVPGSPYELNIIYDEGLPALLTVTDAGYLELRTVSEDHPTAFPVGEGLYRIGSGDIVGFLTAH